MAVTLKGDQEISNTPTIKGKALRINLNKNIYGTFSEIGAGQETVRNFFRSGGSSGTIAKAMSAYDKDFSDAIYGIEDDKRYVTETRLKKMVKHEINLMEERLSRSKDPDKLYFSYANTVQTIDFSKKFKGHGWVGIRFQLDPLEDYNEIVLHLRFKETDVTLQQETLGKLGVNLIYGAFYLNDNPKDLLISLYDNLHKDQLEIDMINFSGPRFMYVDNRLMSLQLVKNEMTNAVMFDASGVNLLPAQELYKKNILTHRGSFRPVTKVNMDIYENAKKLFFNENKVDKENTKIIFEITLSNLRADGKINERDFLDRAELLCSLGLNVMITNFKEYYKLTEYFSEFTKSRMGLAMGVDNMVKVFEDEHYRNLSGGILEAVGKLFFKDLKIYMYPSKQKNTPEILTSKNLKVQPRVQELYNFFKRNGKLIDIKEYDPKILHVNSRTILEMIAKGEKGWEEMLPEGISDLIKRRKLFGYTPPRASKN
jgi:hypothetical protein